jgi:hypothetical protein
MGYGLDSRGADYRSKPTTHEEQPMSDYLHQHIPNSPETKAAARAEAARLEAIDAAQTELIERTTKERHAVRLQLADARALFS